MAFRQNKPTPNSPLNSAEIRDNLQHLYDGSESLKTALKKEHIFDEANPENLKHKLDEIFVSVSSSTQANLAGTASISGGSSGNFVDLHRTTAGIQQNKYSVQSLLQELVNRSHGHGMGRYSFNCNCNCGGNN